MAQFGSGKNPPWARAEAAAQQSSLAAAALQNIAAAAATQQVGVAHGQAGAMLTQPGVATPTVYSLATTNPSLAQHQYTAPQLNMVAQVQQSMQPAVQLPQPGIALPTTLATVGTNQQMGTVSYPAPRGAQAPGPQPKQRVFTGTVTKLHENFGFVDEDVFFQTSCVKGNLPKVGDRVLVEATYNINMPFKWNATRIQVLPNQPISAPGPAPIQQAVPTGPPQPRGGSMGVGGPQITPSQMQPSNMNQPPPLMGQQTQPTPGVRQGNQSGRQNERSGFRDRDRDRPRDRDKDRDRDRHERRERRSPPRKRSRSPRRSKSPTRGASRSSPAPRRRAQRIVPRYTVSIPKLTLDTKEANVITLRSRYNNLYIPSDFFNAAFRWTEAFPLHRPFNIWAHSCTYHVMHKEVDPLEKFDAALEPPDADHLFSAKVMLLSTPPLEDLYHKSCALAEDPTENQENFQHPTRLLQFLVGLKGKEPMAIGGPWSPSLDGADPTGDPRVLINTAIRTTRALTGIDLSNCTQWYRFAEIRYHRPQEMHKGRMVPARVETVVIFLPDAWSCQPSRLDWETMQESFKKQLSAKIQEETKEEESQEDEEDGGDASGEKKDPTHFSELDPKTMKVADLRRELECRTLSSKGLKSQLIARLTKAIKSEQEKEEQEAEDKAEEEEKKEEEPEKPELDDKEEEKKHREEEERKRREEREAAARERRYTLPDQPAVLVHPSTTAKSGKFDCTVMSLSLLLDYRQEDNKEHSFEVSLFAELFNEMLMRDFGFCIYKALVSAPEKKDEEKDKKKDKSEHKDKDKDKDKGRDDKDKAEKKDTEGSGEPSSKRRKSGHDDDKDEKKEDKDKKDKEKDDKEKERSDDKSVEDADDDDDKDSSSRDKDRERHRSREKDRSGKREKVKFVTAHPDLLLSFVYFDHMHTGYLIDKDAEEILHTIGLHLSRAQVKKLVRRVVSRDTLNYRKLTDKPMSKDSSEENMEQTDEQKEGEGEEGEEKMETEEGNQEGQALGNLPYLQQECFSSGGAAARNAGNGDKPAGAEGEKEEGPGHQGIVMFKGAMLDINSFMQRLERSEKTRTATEHKLKDLQEEMDMLKASFSSSEQNSQKVALELQELKKKLRDQRKATETSEANSKKYHEMLLRSRYTLQNLMSDFKSTLGEKDEKPVVKQEVNGK